jgi:protein-tyrosine phosphatase
VQPDPARGVHEERTNRQMETDRQRERRIRLQGSYNFRDIGGYPTLDGRSVRWQRVYRSDALFRLTEQDLAILQPLGVATLIDLRTPLEVSANGPSPLIATHGVRHSHRPFFQDPVDPDNLNALPDLPVLYAELIEKGPETIRGIFEDLANEANYPAVIHCAVGKDRTGIVISLLLRTLGVADETIVADYALTEPYLLAFVDELRRTGNGHFVEGIRDELFLAPAATMRGFLDVVDTRFGGTDQLLADAGVPAGAQEEIRRLLLEAPVS